MGTTGWRGSCARRGWWVVTGADPCRPPDHTTRRAPAATPASDLVQRNFQTPAPDQLWIADITYLPTEEDGFLYLAVILDVYRRRVVGWSMQEHLRTELVIAALEMGSGADDRRRDSCTIRITAASTRRCSSANGVGTWGSSVPWVLWATVGDCFDNAMFDNAMMESFFATLECELLAKHRFRTHDETRAAVFDWLAIFYNRQRRHSALGYLAPAVNEQTYPTHALDVA